MSQDRQNVAASPGAMIAPLLTPTRVFGGLALYFLLHVLWRVLVSDSVELDESEQVISAQSWSWGYAEQPPLYTWLQKLVFSLFGLNVGSLIGLKCLLLFATYYFVYRAAKEIWDEDSPALLSALCLFFIPQIAWESQRDLTHSVLATALAAATLFVFLRLARTGNRSWYATLGLVAGMGLLAKYNYLLFVLALLMAALTLPDVRRQLLSVWLLLTAAMFLLVATPHLLWLAVQGKTETAISKLTFSNTDGVFYAYLAGAQSFLEGILNFSGPLVLVFVLLFLKRPVERRAAIGLWRPDAAKLTLRTVLAVVAICALAVICFKAQFKPRWFQPLLFLLPIPLLAIVQSRLTLTKSRLLAGFAGLVAVAILVIMPAITVGASVTHRPNRLNAPWKELAAKLKKSMPNPGVIVADSCLAGGNLKRHFAGTIALAPECKIIPPPQNVSWLIVWEAHGERPPPTGLAELCFQLRGARLADFKHEYISAPCKYWAGKEYTLGYAVLPPMR